MKYSERLGEISNQQLQKALDTFSLGKFVKAEPINQGVFGQNLFLTSTKGEFVLRGVPHYSWQFKNEKLFVDLLKQHTQVPVPWPYLLDESEDIFGWSYVIMPRLKGHQLSDSDLAPFPDHQLKDIAKAQGIMLAEAQKLTRDYCGKYDEQTNSIKKFERPYFEWLKDNIFAWLKKAQTYNHKTTKADFKWIEQQFDHANEWLSNNFQPCFVMQDYKPGNMVIDKIDNQWQVTGLFDLMESYFGHPETDISRMFCVYVNLGRKDLAKIFVNTYLNETHNSDGFYERFPLFMIHDRAIIWEWAQRTNRVWWDKTLNFEQWTKTFLI